MEAFAHSFGDCVHRMVFPGNWAGCLDRDQIRIRVGFGLVGHVLGMVLFFTMMDELVFLPFENLADPNVQRVIRMSCWQAALRSASDEYGLQLFCDDDGAILGLRVSPGISSSELDRIRVFVMDSLKEIAADWGESFHSTHQ